MKTRVLFILTIALMIGSTINAQRGVRIGYIDTEYILENIPEYQEATSQLEGKVQKWKTEIEQKLNEVEIKKKNLSNESVLLTKELIEEREEDIQFEENEILDYQQKRFGPNGDLIIQKKQLIQPIQDQIFAAVQDIAKNKKFDFVFDKSADVVMLYSAERFDISEQVLRAITRASKRKQALTKKEKREAEQEEVVPEINKELEARQKAIEENKAKRAQAAEERRQKILAEREAKKQEALERRQKILEEREKARKEKLDARKSSTENEEEKTDGDVKEEKNEEEIEKTPEQILEERRQKKLAEREARKKALEERKQKILADREKARQEKLKQREENKNNTKEEEQDDQDQDDNN